jgi:hypothetical protein
MEPLSGLFAAREFSNNYSVPNESALPCGLE